jgi:hypothetical protein
LESDETAYSKSAYVVDHPDFVLASTDVPHVIIEEADGTTHFLSVLLITSVEVAGPSAVV